MSTRYGAKIAVTKMLLRATENIVTTVKAVTAKSRTTTANRPRTFHVEVIGGDCLLCPKSRREAEIRKGKNTNSKTPVSVESDRDESGLVFASFEVTMATCSLTFNCRIH